MAAFAALPLLAQVAIGAMGVSSALSAVAAVRQGQTAQAEAKFQAEQSQQDAVQARAAASTAEDEQRMKARSMIGTQLAAESAAGMQLNGSASDVLRQSLFSAEADSQQIRYQGENAARGYQNQAAGDLFSGRQAMTNGYLSAAGTLMSGVGSVAGSYGQAKKLYNVG